MLLKVLVMIFGLLIVDICHAKTTDNIDNLEHSENSNHHRQKRLFWITHDGRIALPPGTILVITPTLELPFVRYPLEGFFSNLTMSLPFTIKFDTLGLTDNSNPFGTFPFSSLGGRKYKRDADDATDQITSFVKRRLLKRNTQESPPPNAFHGGERALLYSTAEDMLSTLGLDGKACLLRAICEVQSHPLINFGLVGEVLKLFFAASKSPFAGLLDEYVEAENRGKIHGECWPYFKNCPKSLFLPSTNRYSKDSNVNDKDDDVDEELNAISDDDDDDRDVHHTREHMLNPIM
ncbi:hypothetical protein PV328_001965 [Microctonus aethiopoides]|uniref:Uncharacterized protein n=1 Tax=Microctonus aethiopoides TaxID=144406 RepID=A0AA39KY60_9HYME|nr:hypothetical protein PV328_001965 [Microctonus aethiopoides]